jgi:flagellar biosynthesis protein FlhB
MKRISSMRNVSSERNIFNPDEEFNQTPNNLLEAYRRVLKELHFMKLQLKTLKSEFNDGFEHGKLNFLLKTKGITQWSSKYSRRLLIFSNLFLSIYVFFQKLNEIYFGPSFFVQKFIRVPFFKKQVKDNFSERFLKTMWKETLCSSTLLLATYWLFSRNEWKNNLALLCNLSISIYLSLFTKTSFWVLYFNLFALIFYILNKIQN